MRAKAARGLEVDAGRDAPDVALKLLAAAPPEHGRPVDLERRKDDVDPAAQAADRARAVVRQAQDDKRLLERDVLAGADLVASDGVEDESWVRRWRARGQLGQRP